MEKAPESYFAKKSFEVGKATQKTDSSDEGKRICTGIKDAVRDVCRS